MALLGEFLSFIGVLPQDSFSVAVGRYTQSAQEQRDAFKKAQAIWEEAAQEILCA